ncbi:conjugal transfer protein [Kitasatospora sp. NPDC001660]
MPATSAPTSDVPWRVEEEGSGKRWAARAGRGLIWSVIGLAAITGVRSWFWPNRVPVAPPPAVVAAPSYPVQDAQAVAARWARAYLSWDEASPDARTTALSADMAKPSDKLFGWDGRGHQDVVAVQPGTVTVASQGQARVHVDVLVRPAPAHPPAGSTAAASPPDHWIGLDVPVTQSGGRTVVTGEPGIVGMPTMPSAVPAPPAPQSDPALSIATKEAVTAFFSHYASGDIETVTAPGAQIPALTTGLVLDGVQSWSADAVSADGSSRTGTAVVRWRISGAVMESTYRVELARVSTADAQRWQVSAIHGGTP